MPTTAVIIIADTHLFMGQQTELLRKHCTDTEFDIIYVDNSTNTASSNAIKKTAKVLRCKYLHVTCPGDDGAYSCAANTAYLACHTKYAMLFYADQYLAPNQPFNIAQICKGKVLVGVKKQRTIDGEKITYMLPGAVFINMKLLNDSYPYFAHRESVDFGSCHGLGAGSNLHRLIDFLAMDQVAYLSEAHHNGNPLIHNTFLCASSNSIEGILDLMDELAGNMVFQ